MDAGTEKRAGVNTPRRNGRRLGTAARGMGKEGSDVNIRYVKYTPAGPNDKQDSGRYGERLRWARDVGWGQAYPCSLPQKPRNFRHRHVPPALDLYPVRIRRLRYIGLEIQRYVSPSPVRGGG